MFKKIKELLDEGTISQAAADALDGEVSVALKEKNDEAASWRVKYQDLNKNFEAISKTKDDLESKLSGFDEAIKKAKEDGKGELVKELETQRASTQEIQANLEAIQNENKNLKIQTALSGALSKYDVIDNDLVSTFIRGNVELNGDALIYKNGDSSMSIEDGLKGFFDEKQHLLKAQGNSGSGAGTNGNSGGDNQDFIP